MMEKGYLHISPFYLLFISTCSKWVDCCDLSDMKCKVCSPGYVGSDCSEQCRYLNYGQDCQGLCNNCIEEFCDIATGCFSPTDGCRVGYYGHRCINKCRYPNFGKACQNKCQCSESLCHFISGCNISDHENGTSSNMLHPKEQYTIKSTAIGVIVLVSALSSIIISAVISLFIWRLRVPYRSRRRASQSSPHQQEQQKSTGARKQKTKHVSLETNNRTNVYSSSDIAGPSYLQTSSLEVYSDFSQPDCDCAVRQRESTTDTVQFDVSSCTYEPMISTLNKDSYILV